MNNETNQKKTRKKCPRKGEEPEKLRRAVSTLASIIDSLATSLKCEIDEGNMGDVKLIKELTGAAKELSALMGSMSEKNGEKEGEGDRVMHVAFREDEEEWAK